MTKVAEHLVNEWRNIVRENGLVNEANQEQLESNQLFRAVEFLVLAQLRERAIALGAMPISRHADRALMRRVIANARAQGRREAP